MNKLIYYFAFLMILGSSWIACDNEVEDYDIKINPVTPDLSAVGVYEGTWERMLLTDSSIVKGEGHVVVESDTAYLISLQFVSEDFKLDKSAVANITYANGGYYYFNNSDKTDLKATFYGTISKDSELTSSFTINQVENRRVKKFQYTFVGRKVENSVVKE